MSFSSILETIFIGPLKLIFEVIYQYALGFVKNPGFAIIFLSLVMNILVLPLYRRADAVQEEAKDIENKLKKGTSHIKKTFSGNERMMMLQTYNRQNNYKPTDVFKGSVSLLLEIPFFMAAYQFLSHLKTLNGVRFGPIADLGKPDGLLVIFGITINLLPVLMTLINVIASAIYLKGFPLKTKIQLYGIAAFFLVFLYTSPSGLVFYWTLNNVFSLVKNIFYKIRNPKKVLKILTSLLGGTVLVLSIFVSKARIPLILIGICLFIPLISSIIKKRLLLSSFEIKGKPNTKLFLLGGAFLASFIGLFIPSTYISASPQEYIDVTFFYNPLNYILSSLCMAIGFFLVWFSVFYWLANEKWKIIFEKLIWIMCGCAVINYMFFGTRLGVISSALKYESGMSFKLTEHIINILVILSASVALCFIVIKFKRFTSTLLLTSILAITLMSGLNVYSTKKDVDEINELGLNNFPHFELSQNGKNVVVIMLDRAMGLYVPYIFNELPELKEKFDGFTYYSNTLSFGKHTNFGAPALVGGYEYTPVEMNKRKEERLEDKHNEALLVMPVLFSNNGYNVTVCDPPYAGYDWIPDLSIFDDYDNVESYITKGAFDKKDVKQQLIDSRMRNFFMFGVMKSLPTVMQKTLYKGGTYVQAGIGSRFQTTEGLSKAKGSNALFMQSYNVMDNLDNITRISNDGKNNFLFLANEMTHEGALLSEPNYIPKLKVDNTKYDEQHSNRFTIGNDNLNVDTLKQMMHYHINASAYVKLAEWFDYLKENGVYDNTKIILVSDHAYNLYQSDSLIKNGIDLNAYFPLLMVKDFNSKGFNVSDEFMTNADVPTLATDGVINNPVNPFTNKPINSDEKFAHEQYVTLSSDYSTLVNNGNTYLPSGWISVKDNIRDKNNWTIIDDNIVLNDHKIPN